MRRNLERFSGVEVWRRGGPGIGGEEARSEGEGAKVKAGEV